MKVFILSAGLGTRLLPLTKTKPKVMVPIGNKPILEHLINLCRFHGFKDIIINLHAFPEIITDYFQDGSKFGVHINYSRETEKIMGGAGALKQAEKLLDQDHFFVLNGDVMTNVDLTAMAKFHLQKQGIGSFLVHKTDHPLDSDLVDYNENFLVARIYRPKEYKLKEAISKTGTHIFSPSVFNFIPLNKFYSLESQLLPDLISKKQSLYAYYSDCYSKDMGTLPRLNQVIQDYEANKISF